MKKVILALFVIFLSIGIAAFIPWEDFLYDRLDIFQSNPEFSSLRVYSLSGELIVILDDEEKGSIKSTDGYLEVFPIEPGEHQLVLKRASNTEDFFTDFNQRVTFAPNFETVVSWEAGPSTNSSAGWILEAERNTDAAEDQNSVALQMSGINGEDYTVLLNKNDEFKLPISDKSLNADQEHVFLISKEGYQNLEFTIFSNDIEEFEDFSHFDIKLRVNLYKVPIEYNK